MNIFILSSFCPKFDSTNSAIFVFVGCECLRLKCPFAHFLLELTFRWWPIKKKNKCINYVNYRVLFDGILFVKLPFLALSQTSLTWTSKLQCGRLTSILKTIILSDNVVWPWHRLGSASRPVSQACLRSLSSDTSSERIFVITLFFFSI